MWVKVVIERDINRVGLPVNNYFKAESGSMGENLWHHLANSVIFYKLVFTAYWITTVYQMVKTLLQVTKTSQANLIRKEFYHEVAEVCVSWSPRAEMS